MPQGRIIRGTTLIGFKKTLLAKFSQTSCHDNGASRNRLLNSAILLRNEAHYPFAPPYTDRRLSLPK